MKENGQIKVGSAVESTDGKIGSVAQIIVASENGELLYLSIQEGWNAQEIFVPAQTIKEITKKNVVKLNVTREELRLKSAEISAKVKPADQQVKAETEKNNLRIPLVEERLVVAKKEVDLGEVRLKKFVDEKEEIFREPVSHEDVEIKRIACNQPLEVPRETRNEGEWLIIPVMEEVIVLHRQLMLKEEIHIRKRSVTQEQELREITRHERIEVENIALRAKEIAKPEPVRSSGKNQQLAHLTETNATASEAENIN